jgi:hypothetical protein
MKKINRFVSWQLFIVMAAILFSACSKDTTDKKDTKTFTIYTPVYQSKSTVLASINGNATQSIEHAGKIYIRSTLLGDNEGIAVINRNSLVDVYSATDGSYIKTYYIPKQQGESFREMCILRDQLIAVYPHSFVAYHFPSKQP